MARRPGAGWLSAEGARRCADRCAAETTRHALEAERAATASATQAAFLADSSSRASRTTMPLEIPPTTVSRLVASSPTEYFLGALKLLSVYFPPRTRTDGASNAGADALTRPLAIHHERSCDSTYASSGPSV